MAVKRKLSKAEYEALSEEKREFYIENKDRRGEYILDMDPDFNKELTTTLDALKAEKEELETKLADLGKELETAKSSKQPKDGSVSKEDFEAYKSSAEKKYKTDVEKLTGDIAKKDAAIKKHLVDGVANSMAAKLSSSPRLLIPHIKSRLDVDMTGDEPKTVILDKDGRPSAFTIEDLEQEFVADKDFSSILIGSRAQGGNPPDGFRGNSPNTSEKPFDLQHAPAQQAVAALLAKHPDLAKA
jgi:hypothetical protein